MLLSYIFAVRHERSTGFAFGLAVIFWSILVASCAQLDTSPFLPEEIKDFQMGMSSEQVLAGIKNPDSYKRSDLNLPGRFMISWPLENSKLYKRIEFEFTEKNRLYQARFVLRDELRWKTKPLKKKFFKRFGISWYDPGKMRMSDKDVLIYVPVPEKRSPNFFDMTDVKTGEKWFEVFDRSVSSTDRYKPKKAKKKKAKTDSESSKAPSSPVKSDVPDTPQKTKSQ
jgi:hypothetical protein